MKSIYKNLGGYIEMPEFKGRNLYMHKQKMDSVDLPMAFADYNSVIDSILSKLSDRSSVCYVTIDEKIVSGGTHRRSGIHCDLNWYEDLKAHGTGGHRLYANGKWGGWSDPKPSGWGGWSGKEIIGGGLLLVSNYSACKVWKGEFDGELLPGGDCSKIDVSNLESEVMPEGEVYYLNALGIHESLLINKTIRRQLIRVSLHPEYIIN